MILNYYYYLFITIGVVSIFFLFKKKSTKQIKREGRENEVEIMAQRNQREIIFEPSKEGLKLQSQNYWRSSEHYDKISTLINEKKTSLFPHFDEVEKIDKRGVFFIRNCLNKEECEEIIKAAEKTGFEFRNFEANGKDSASAVALSQLLADSLYQRISKFAPQISYFDAGLGVVLNDFVYDNQLVKYYGELVGINPSIRVERYEKGQQLKMHRDGLVLVKDLLNTYTVYAILIYLNDDYDEGFTRFAVSKTPKNPNDLYEYRDLKGKIGDALVFRHEFLHCGGTVANGVKYVLRLDFAYRLITE